MDEAKDTKERLLDAAEQLFARQGYHNTSLRAITAEAGANLAAVNYHFGSKEALMGAVVERRLLPLNALRLQRLEAAVACARRDGRPPAVAELLLAFVEPTLKFKEASRGARHFITLIGRAVSDPADPVRRKFMALIGPVLARLFALLREARPDIPPEVLQLRLFFSISSLAHAMMMDETWPSLAENVSLRHDAKTLVAQLVPFLTAGLEAAP